MPRVALFATLHGTRVVVLVHDLEVCVVDDRAGELIRSLVIHTARDYQLTGEPPGSKHGPKPAN